MTCDGEGPDKAESINSDSQEPSSSNNREKLPLKSKHETGEPKVVDTAHNNEGGNRFVQLGKKSIVYEWLTFFVGCGALLVGVGSLVVSYWTYRNAADTTDIKQAVVGLAKLAKEAKRQADNSDRQISILANQVAEQQAQTNAIAGQTTVLREQTLAAQQSALAASEGNRNIVQTRELEQRAWLSISANIEGDLAFDGHRRLPITIKIVNAGNTPALHIRINAWIGYRTAPHTEVAYQAVTAYQMANALSQIRPRVGAVILPKAEKIIHTEAHDSYPPGDTGYDTAFLVVGVQYNTVFDEGDAVHHTIMSYDIVPSGDPPSYLRPIPRAALKNDIMLRQPLYIGGDIAN